MNSVQSLHNLYAFFGHHKCATIWITSIARHVCRHLELKHVSVSNPCAFNHELVRFISENKIDFLCYGNAEIEHVNSLSNFRGFHVIRDPRDIIISAYFSHLYSHPTTEWPELIVHRARLKSSSKDEGLFIEMEFSRNELEDLYRWDYHQPNVLEIKMEDLIYQPYEHLRKAFDFLGLIEDTSGRVDSHMLSEPAGYVPMRTNNTYLYKPNLRKLPAIELFRIVYEHRYTVESGGRSLGDEDVTSHYRKGVAGDWVNHFTLQHRLHFKKSFNDVLLKLGYETSLDW